MDWRRSKTTPTQLFTKRLSLISLRQQIMVCKVQFEYKAHDQRVNNRFQFYNPVTQNAKVIFLNLIRKLFHNVL